MANDTIERLKKIVSAVRRPTSRPSGELSYLRSLEELIEITRRKSISLEERIPRNETLMKRNEILYRLDPLVWAGVNKLTRLIASPQIYFTGAKEEDVVAMEMFLDRIGLRLLLPSLIKDIFIYGYGVAEIEKDAKGRILKLSQIDPKTFDYIREERMNYIARNPDGTIRGYIQKIIGEEEKEFSPDRIILLRFYLLGEECLGLSPLEPVYKASWIKLNLEEALGEAVYRHGFPIYWFKIGGPEAYQKGFEVTPAKIKEAKQYLKDLSTANELIIPWWIEPGRLEARSRISDLSEFLQYLSAEIMSGLEIPKIYGTATEEIQANVAQETLDFEKTIKTFQVILAEQLETQLFSQYRKVEAKRIEFPFPKLNFTEHSEETKMFRARRLAQYSKYNLITPDENLETDIRKIEGLTPKKVLSPKESCIFGWGECRVRSSEPKISPENLARFCSSCIKTGKGKLVKREQVRMEEKDKVSPS